MNRPTASAAQPRRCRWFSPAELGPTLHVAGHQDTHLNQEDDMIDKDRIKGSAEQAKGKVKEWAGKVTGDKKTEAEGKADQVKGKVQNAFGGVKDAVRGK
jgi:uncharacterized protein YjbJ (UPF0337 family)